MIRLKEIRDEIYLLQDKIDSLLCEKHSIEISKYFAQLSEESEYRIYIDYPYDKRFCIEYKDTYEIMGDSLIIHSFEYPQYPDSKVNLCDILRIDFE